MSALKHRLAERRMTVDYLHAQAEHARTTMHETDCEISAELWGLLARELDRQAWAIKRGRHVR